MALNITCPVTSGSNYQVKLVSSKGNQFLYTAVAQTEQEENLYLTKQHVWYNTTGAWAEAAIVIINTGGTDVVLDKVTVRGQEVPWSNVYYWKTNTVTISSDLNITPIKLTGTNFDMSGTFTYTTDLFTQATDDLSLISGWTLVIYVKDLGSISLNDVGIPVGITIFTANAQYYKECLVGAAQ